MERTKEKILPFFIPHLGCPNDCIFCNQRAITGEQNPISIDEIRVIIAKETEPKTIAYYGGSFTALPDAEQIKYLEVLHEPDIKPKVAAIRISTRPDSINAKKIALLQKYQVKTVELGVQSMTDSVLDIAKRGHSAIDAIKALRELKEAGFETGVQLMLGLPTETEAETLEGARKILAEKPDLLRIYPVVVIKNTELAKMFDENKYESLSVDEAVSIAAKVRLIADANGVKTIRTGLNWSEDFNEQDYLAGAYHPAFGALVKGEIMKLWAETKLEPNALIYVSRRNFAPMVGENARNKKFFAKQNIAIKIDDKLKDDEIVVGKTKINYQDFIKNHN